MYSKKFLKRDNGFTLLELLVTISLSGIVIVLLAKLYLSTFKDYNLQDDLAEMNQNADYVIKRIGEELLQAGAYLPDSAYNIVCQAVNKYDSIEILSNPRCAQYQFVIDINNKAKIPVENAQTFTGTENIVKFCSSGAISELFIDKSYNKNKFVNGIDTTSDPDSICFSNKVSFSVGDMIFSVEKHRLFVDNTNFCYDTKENVIAENIDSLCVLFLDKSNNITTNWNKMHFARIYVRAITSNSDSRYKDPVYKDGYRRYSQSMELLLRNSGSK